MDLQFKKISNESKIAISNAFNKNEDNSYFIEAKDKISQITSHENVRLVNSGNSAILTALNSINEPILVPNQGSWHGFKQIAKFLNKEIIEFKTDQGLVNIDYLQDTIDKIEFNKNNYYNGAIALTSFAGYTAEQPIKKIAKFANENDLILIEDASGGILDDKKNLGNGKYSDIIVCSTGSYKIINLTYGGFISTNNQEIFENSKLLLKTLSLNNEISHGLVPEIKNGVEAFKIAIKSCNYLKKNLCNVIYPDKRGLNVILSSEISKKSIINLRNKFNLKGHLLTRCPSYNRIKEKAIAIEIKNLSPKSLNKESLDYIVDIISNFK
jgi:hypothetical protein